MRSRGRSSSRTQTRRHPCVRFFCFLLLLCLFVDESSWAQQKAELVEKRKADEDRARFRRFESLSTFDLAHCRFTNTLFPSLVCDLNRRVRLEEERRKAPPPVPADLTRTNATSSFDIVPCSSLSHYDSKILFFFCCFVGRSAICFVGSLSGPFYVQRRAFAIATTTTRVPPPVPADIATSAQQTARDLCFAVVYCCRRYIAFVVAVSSLSQHARRRLCPTSCRRRLCQVRRVCAPSLSLCLCRMLHHTYSYFASMHGSSRLRPHVIIIIVIMIVIDDDKA
jgi:hypothetical protein